MNQSEYFIGLMSGTSMDSIDAVAIKFGKDKLECLGSHKHEIPKIIKKQLAKLCQSNDSSIALFGSTDIQMGVLFAEAAKSLMSALRLTPKNIIAIGCHGQTIRHSPPGGPNIPFSIQIGDPNTIATRTNCPIVADFRRADMALGGQGAPLTPAFHEIFFSHPSLVRIILNIGGIANITVLSPDRLCIGFDTGPGNVLLDGWCLRHQGNPFDENGNWGAGGTICKALLRQLKKHPYLKQSSPKSTGRESFNLKWLEQQLKDNRNHNALSAPQDVQATLCKFTADTITSCIESLKFPIDEIYVCGGGARNQALMKTLKQNVGSVKLYTTENLGIHPDNVEAAAFAWLAMRRINSFPGNLPSVTGASNSTVLGGVYLP
ncbi:MAG: anhydro-N-acetylmuramic acid kinase [Cellvibrionales bacterium TMED49]|nr:anhydro-N-acetylmuramic acid kinase [Porticoccaceae bacterium]OUU38599.1 MAG: anhydro-N-acetylmuramic acid kinase [Cellvibrionales bacterium TMED49]|tara:strand:+ start:156 stop:1283 length:1128 start_codon:yes stop_codon:yes gene_type:complete